ncbi:MAG TPA: diguanylate cyclase, partial [Mycobacteriales bacterium]|nr:diguanylate cyclase [Mycobacteriales bacterium]
MRRLVRPGLAGWHRRLAAVASARARTGVIEVLPHVRASSGFVVAMVALTTCAGWLLAMLSGHGAIVTSYWLCLPVVIAAGRFGRPGAFVAAVGASLGAGPLTMLAPSGDGSGKAEPLVWFMGAVFFVIVGQVVTGLLRRVHQADSRIAGAMNEQRDRAVDALAERDVLSQRLAHQATHDPVTGLPNRLLFLQRLEDTLLHSAPTQSVGVLFIDLDDFKTVNDSLGHAAGDELLMGVAQRLQNAIRGGDVVARFGGDEFAVLLHQGTAENASGLANRLLGVLRTPFALAAGMASGQASGGLVLACRDGQQPIAEQAADLLRRADLAMYAAKAAGGGRCVEFRDEFHDAMLERLSLRDDIVAAQIREEFYLHYQPVIDLRTRRVVAVEALLRWTHPVRGEISPVRFIPIAEESGAIVQLGLWVLEQACADLQRWDELCPGNGVSITVNLSARQLRESSVGAQIARVLHHAGVDP